jgi:hypothetical protein
MSVGIAREPLQQPIDLRTESMELRAVGVGKLFEDGLAAWTEREPHPAAIILGRHAPGVSLGDQSVDKSDCAVMPDLQRLRQLADGNSFTAREALDGEESLMALGRDAGRSRRLFAEAQEPPQRIAESGEHFVLGLRDP